MTGSHEVRSSILLVSTKERHDASRVFLFAFCARWPLGPSVVFSVRLRLRGSGQGMRTAVGGFDENGECFFAKSYKLTKNEKSGISC